MDNDKRNTDNRGQSQNTGDRGQNDRSESGGNRTDRSDS